jgi:heat shock protein HtpX
LSQFPDTSSVIHREQQLAHRAYPANVTFNDLIRANKRKSVLLMVGMSMLLVIVGGLLTAAIVGYSGGDATVLLPSIILGAVVAGVIAIIASTWSFFGGSEAILKISGAIEISPEMDPQLHNVVEELAIAAGIPKPRVFVINDTALNAFATGRDPQHAAVAITVGLRQQLSRDELAGVMAHELSHIRHFDIRFAMLMATMVGLIVLACDAFWRVLRVGMFTGGSRRSSGGGGKDGGAGAVYAVILVVALILAIIAPMLAMMIRFAMSRQREYLADAGAVELTRYPQGLISALEKLGACHEPLEVANRATAHLYIVNPLKSAMRGEGHELNSVFRTHPPLHDRIARLQALIQ